MIYRFRVEWLAEGEDGWGRSCGYEVEFSKSWDVEAADVGSAFDGFMSEFREYAAQSRVTGEADKVVLAGIAIVVQENTDACHQQFKESIPELAVAARAFTEERERRRKAEEKREQAEKKRREDAALAEFHEQEERREYERLHAKYGKM
jgi:hypothetical protein